ncbi:Mitogen-activated protein kinase [Aphelenchoides bicaudatus]|nr:Mitogen-activated protein kinase [Aphelenchoides bicaudatus]
MQMLEVFSRSFNVYAVYVYFSSNGFVVFCDNNESYLFACGIFVDYQKYHHSMALVSHSTIGGPSQFLAQSNQPAAEAGIVVVGGQQQQQIMNAGKPGSSSGSSISGSDSLSGSSSSTTVPSHLNNVRYGHQHAQPAHYGHHQQAQAAMIPNGSPSDANHLVKALFSTNASLYNQQASPRRATEPDKPIGYGAFGVVWSVTDPRSQKRVALKKMPNVFQNLASCKRVFREIQMLASFRHDNVLGLLDILHPPNQHFFQEIHVLTELMQSDLHKIIVSPQQLTVDHVKVFIYQILRGLKYLHSAKILHRDIKPGNLLVNSNCILKICDFGLARIWDKSDTTSNMTHEVVTQYYRAPELLMGARKYTGAIDVWSVGCIFAELLGRRILFQAHGPIEQLNQIVALLGTPTPEAMRTACEGARNHVLRNSRHQHDPARLNRQFPLAGQDAIQLLTEMLQFDPDKRISVVDALQSPYLTEGRLRFHSCMCSCCFNASKRGGRNFTNDYEPDHDRPFNPLWEKELSRLSMFELRERMYNYIIERKPLYDTPLCININSATFSEFQQSSVAQPSELPPPQQTWD